VKEVTQCTVVFCLGTERSVHLLSANWRAEVMYIGGLFGFSFKTADLQAVLSPHSLCTVDKSALAVFIQDGTPAKTPRAVPSGLVRRKSEFGRRVLAP
jgi:hypothetical protein